jgi:hypothetical protein
MTETEKLRSENEQLKIRIVELERTIQMRPRGRAKGTGTHYADKIIRLNKKHRQLLYGLLVKDATDWTKAIPAQELRKMFHLRTAPTSGRMSELIGKGLVKCTKARISFQPDSEGILQYRPETELDANLGTKRYRRFVYWITLDGIETLHCELLPSDEFVQVPQLEIWLKVARPEQLDRIRRIVEDTTHAIGQGR